MESLSLLNHIRSNSPVDFTPLDSLQKTMRGLWIVSLYAAFERSANAIVEAAIAEIAAHGAPSINFAPSIQGIIHYAKVQAVKDCGQGTVFDKSALLFSAAFSGAPVDNFENPLAERMMNVDGKTLKWLAGLFGAGSFEVEGADLGRLGALRERRNAVAHGREPASNVGERYTLSEMANLYAAADRVSMAFLLVMKDHCIERRYLRSAA